MRCGDRSLGMQLLQSSRSRYIGCIQQMSVNEGSAAVCAARPPNVSIWLGVSTKVPRAGWLAGKSGRASERARVKCRVCNSAPHHFAGERALTSIHFTLFTSLVTMNYSRQCFEQCIITQKIPCTRTYLVEFCSLPHAAIACYRSIGSSLVVRINTYPIRYQIFLQ